MEMNMPTTTLLIDAPDGSHESTEDLSSLEKKVGTVVALSQDLDAAIAEEREQRAALLEVILRTVKPALPGLAGPIKVENCSGDAYGSGQYTKHHPKNGIWLDGTEGPTQDNPSDREGSYGGWDTYLLVDGSILDLEYYGHWSIWDNEPCTWVAKAHIFPPEKAPKYLVDEGSDHNTIDAIQAAFDKWIDGNPARRAEQARARASKLREIVGVVQ